MKESKYNLSKNSLPENSVVVPAEFESARGDKHLVFFRLPGGRRVSVAVLAIPFERSGIRGFYGILPNKYRQPNLPEGSKNVLVWTRPEDNVRRSV